MKKQSRTVPRRRQSVSPTPRYLPLVDILIDTQAELQELVVASGLKVLEAMLEEDRTAVCGPRYAHQPERQAYRAWHTPSQVVLSGRKVAMRRPRARRDGTETAVRGAHPTRLLLDEIDEMKLPILEAAQGQPMDRNGVRAQTVMSSTHQHPDGTVTAMRRRAADLGWPVSQWCYRETLAPHGWLTEDQVVRKQAELSRTMWAVEYELQEPRKVRLIGRPLMRPPGGRN